MREFRLRADGDLRDPIDADALAEELGLPAALVERLVADALATSQRTGAGVGEILEALVADHRRPAPGRLTARMGYAAPDELPGPGKLSLASMIPGQSAAGGRSAAAPSRPAQSGSIAVQRRDTGGPGGDSHALAERGVAGGAGPLPHLERIQASFGRHEIRDVRAHSDAAAREASAMLGAHAYTRGRDVAFTSRPDLHTAAHEAAHVVQQRGGVQLAGGFGESGDRHERHADAVADAVVRGESAEALLDQYATAGSAIGAEAVQRKAFAFDASSYIVLFHAKIVAAVKERVAATNFGTGSALARWRSNGGAFGKEALSVWGDGMLGLLAIKEAIKPTFLEHLVDRSRQLDKRVMGPKGGEPQLWDTTEGKGVWFPGVGVTVADEVISRLTKSLQRIMPRYVAARMRALREEEERRGECLVDLPQPRPSDVLTSHPIDKLTVRALVSSNLVDVDQAEYEKIHPGGEAAHQLRSVTFEFLAPRGAWFWIRVTNHTDATPEEVAKELYGSTEHAHKLTDASPLFGLNDLAGMREDHMKKLVEVTGRSPTSAGYSKFRSDSLAAGYQPGNLDAASEILAGPLAEEAALNQAGEPTGRNRLQILQDLRHSLETLDTIAETARVFGIRGDRLQSARTRLDERSVRLGSAAPAEVAKWDAQAKSQKATLREIASGLDAVKRQYAGMRKQAEAAAQMCALPSAIVLPQHVRRPMRKLAEAYVHAAEAADLTATAEGRLRAAQEKGRLLTVEIMEAILVQAQNAIDEASTAKRQTVGGAVDRASYDVEGMKLRQEALRERVSALRTEIAGGGNPGPALKKLFDEISDLQLEVEMVGNMDTLDEAWQVLEDEDGFIATVTFQDDDIERFQKEAMQWHARWKAIHTKWKSGDRKAANTDLSALRSDKSFQSFLSRAYAEVKDIRFKKGIGKIAALLAITIATMGAGAFATGLAAGLELGTLGTVALTAGVEALTFTALQTIVLEEKPSVGKFFGELAFNFAMFGSLRRFSMAIEATKLAPAAKTAVELTGQAVMLGAWSFAREEVIKYARTGEHLTSSEIADIAVEGLVMFVTMAIVARTGAPILKRLEGSGRVLGTRIRVANRSRVAVNARAQAQQGKRDVNETIELLKAERESMRQELEAYRELERVARNEGKDSPTLKKAGLTMEQLVKMREALTLHGQKMKVAELMLSLETIGPNHYAVPLRSAPKLINELGGKIASETVDPVTGLKTTEVVTADGTRVKLTETVGKDATPAEIAVERAKANLDTAESQPGSGVERPGTLEDGGYFDNATREAGEGAGPSAVLDRLALRLPEDAQLGLKEFRAAKGDEAAHKVLSGMNRGGRRSLTRFLVEQGMSAADKSAALKAVADARVEVARAKLEAEGALADAGAGAKADIDAVLAKLGNKPTQEALDKEVSTRNVDDVTSEIGEAISRKELGRTYRPEDGHEILANIEVVEPVPGYKSVADFAAKNPGATPKELAKLREGGGKLYRSITEIDTVILKTTKQGKEPVAFEQVKTGKNDKHRAAQAQNTKAIDALRSGALAFERTGKTTLGAERTADFANLSGVKQTTRGLEGKGFDASFDLGVEGLSGAEGRGLLESVARLLIKRGVVERASSAGGP